MADFKKSFFKSIPISREIWTFIVTTICALAVLSTCVDLTPHIDESIFFSSDDPQFQSEIQINRLFGSAGTELVISAEGAIESEIYYEKINRLSSAIKTIEGVKTVISLTEGPKNFKDALTGPMWKRLLISQDRKSTLVMAIIELSKSKSIVPKVEVEINRLNADDFQLGISGFPYIVELIARNLTRDLIRFTTITFLVFGLMVYMIFRSKSILFGTYMVCLNACVLTLLVLSLCNVPVGLISSNIPLIVFIMSLSHIVFLTFNWQTAVKEKNENPIKYALGTTFRASFWSMLTTLLGFISLMTVPAKPLRDFGTSGAVGSIIAILTVYTLYPAFLRNIRHIRLEEGQFLKTETKLYKFLEANTKTFVFTICVVCLIVIPGLFKLNTDPSLLSYFSKGGAMYRGLDYIDGNGGSSPLTLVVHNEDYARLTTGKSFRKMWDLQQGLEKHPAVGQALSIPVLLRQAQKEPLAFLLSNKLLVKILESPSFDEVAKGFITTDQRYGLYLLRMYENGRTSSRLEVIDDLKEITKTRGLVPKLVGGVYSLQGNLSKLVVSSLVLGLGKLMLIFTIIILGISRSLKIAISTSLGIMLIPLSILGISGLYGIPLDIVSAPASNVAIGMGIDSIIHMINARRRHIKQGLDGDWQRVRDELYQPIFTSVIVVAVGFIIFLLSAFPPLQRFGVSIVFGALFAGLIALYITPLLFEFKRPQTKS